MFTFTTIPPAERKKAKDKAKGNTGSPMSAVLGSGYPSSEPTSYCPIGTCITLVPEKQLVCRVHVCLVPDDLLDAYWDTYQKGQTLLTASAENIAAWTALIEFGKSVAA